MALTSVSSGGFKFKNEFAFTLMLALFSAIAYDVLKGVVTNQLILIVIGIGLSLFFYNNIIGRIGMGIAVIGIAKYIAKDTEGIIGALSSA